jgi:hypothetical protein
MVVGPAQRAFLIARVKSTGSDKLHATFEASDSSPLVNPAIVIRNWNDPIPRIKINGKDVSWGPEFRVGQVNTLEGTNLVISMNLQTTNPTTVGFISGKQK